MTLHNPFLQRFRLFFEDPKIRKDLSGYYQGNINDSLLHIMLPELSKEEASFSVPISQSDMRNGDLREEIEQAIMYLEDYHRRTRSMQNITSSLGERLEKIDAKKIQVLMRELNQNLRRMEKFFGAFEDIRNRLSEIYLLILENKQILENQGKRPEERGRESLLTKRKSGAMVKRIKELEEINARLQQKDVSPLGSRRSSIFDERGKLGGSGENRDSLKPRDSSRLKMSFLEEENMRMKEELKKIRAGMAGVQKENEELKEKVKTGQQGEKKAFGPMDAQQIAAYEERKRLMEENERLIRTVSELKREKTAVENRRKIEEEKEHVEDKNQGGGRPRMITFGKAVDMRSSGEHKGGSTGEDPKKPIISSSIGNSQQDSKKESGQINNNVTISRMDVKHSRNYSMSDSYFQAPADSAAHKLINNYYASNTPIKDLLKESKAKPVVISGSPSYDIAQSSVPKPYIDISDLLNRSKITDNDQSLGKITTFTLKENR